ncbi:MAG: RsmD family RNA methyltransferase [Bacteroidota bacterium]
MRIIGGELGGRRIQPPTSMPHTRPTTDVAKEALFNILENNLDLSALSSLDLFGGTGCISYELYSRGTRSLTIVEKDAQMVGFIKKTLTLLSIEHIRLVQSDVFRFLADTREQYDLIFAGPPYALGNIDDLPRLIVKHELLRKGGWFVLEHTPRNSYRDFPRFRSERKYGTTIFSIFIVE